MKCIFLHLISLFLFCNIYSQDSSSQTNKIIQKWPGWSLNGNKISRSELKTEIYKVPEAVPFYEKHQKYRVMGVIGLGASVIFTLIDAKDRNNFDGEREIWKRIASTATLTVTLFCLIKSVSPLKKAIKIRNAAY